MTQAQLAVLKRLARMVAFHDWETAEHTERIGALAAGIAEHMELKPRYIAMIRTAAIYHDIGKIGVDRTILKKPGPLTAEEWVQVKQHPVIGAELLEPIFQPAKRRPDSVIALAQRIAETHHERWDGTGYPYGLKATAIPLGGRIVAVCDVFDALTNERPYKRAWTVDAALAEIESQSGRYFDPEVVSAFSIYIRRQHPAIEQHDAPVENRGVAVSSETYARSVAPQDAS
jgi:putative two-component system response regulator